MSQFQNLKINKIKLNSSVSALPVVQYDSTGGIISGGVGGGSTQVSVREILTAAGDSVIDSTNNSIGVTIRAGSAAGTEYTDGDVDATISGQAILFDNSSNTLRPVTLTRGLPVNVVAGAAASTTVNVSSVSGQVTAAYIETTLIDGLSNTAKLPADSSRTGIIRALSASYGFNGATWDRLRTSTSAPASNDIGLTVRQVDYVAPSTTIQVSSLAGKVTVDQNSTVWPVQVSSVAGAVTIRSSAANALVTVYQSSAADLNAQVRLFTSSGGALTGSTTDPTGNEMALLVRTVGGSPGGGSSAVTITRVQDSSNGGIAVGDSENNAIRVNVVAGAAGGSTVVTVSTGSVRVHQSTASDLQATVGQASTVWVAQVSSLGGRVLVDQNSTTWPVQVSSVAGRVLVDQQSTVWPVQVSSVAGIVTVNNNDGAGNALVSATSQPSTNSRGLVVRPVVNGIESTTVVITSTNSTALYTLISSAAGARFKVFAYFVGSTHTSPSTLVFTSSNAIDRWGVNFGSGSSGITGANLALSPPAWMFMTDAANALRCRIEGGSSAASTVIARVSISWFSEA